jgi:outer membrane lipoprotein-sorting protein
LTIRGVRPLWVGVIMILWAASPAFGAAAATDLTVDQIIARHIEARGGAVAWHDIHTMAWTGHVDSGLGGANGVPFLLMFKRPSATHFEIMAQNQKSLRVFDGTTGWKLRPTEQGRPEWQDYSADEVRSALDAAGLDGPLFDYREKGVSIALRGKGTVEGHAAYGLEVTLPSGQKRTDWIDAKSFLELKYDRTVRSAAGHESTVSVYLRDYQKIQGLVLPLTIETGNAAGGAAEKMRIEKIAINPDVPDSAFSKPTIAPKHRGGVVIDTAKPPATHSPEAP